MKRMILSVLLCMLILGCATQTKDEGRTITPSNQVDTIAKEPSPIPEPPATEVEPEEIPTPVPVPKEVEKTNDPIYDELIAKHSKIKTGYSYDFSFFDSSLANQAGNVDNIQVLGDKIKVSHPKLLTHDGFKYNRVYLSVSEGKAYLHCVDVNCKSDNNKVKSADYDAFKIVTPIEMLKEMDGVTPVMEQRYEGIDSQVIKGQIGGAATQAWVSDFYGVPLKIEIEYPDRKVIYRYDSQVMNKVVAVNMTLPPSAEFI